MTTVDVLLICALKDEYDQVLKVNDGRQTDWQEHPLDSGWMVADARFTTSSGSTLSIRATHASYMGREQAQATASKLIHDQPARCIAMSGICAERRGKVALGVIGNIAHHWLELRKYINAHFHKNINKRRNNARRVD